MKISDNDEIIIKECGEGSTLIELDGSCGITASTIIYSIIEMQEIIDLMIKNRDRMINQSTQRMRK